jgi:hypothetical protein
MPPHYHNWASGDAENGIFLFGRVFWITNVHSLTDFLSYLHLPCMDIGVEAHIPTGIVVRQPQTISHAWPFPRETESRVRDGRSNKRLFPSGSHEKKKFVAIVLV